MLVVMFVMFVMLSMFAMFVVFVNIEIRGLGLGFGSALRVRHVHNVRNGRNVRNVRYVLNVGNVGNVLHVPNYRNKGVIGLGLGSAIRVRHVHRRFIIQRGHEHTRRGNRSRGGLVERVRISRHRGPLCSKHMVVIVVMFVMFFRVNQSVARRMGRLRSMLSMASTLEGG